MHCCCHCISYYNEFQYLSISNGFTELFDVLLHLALYVFWKFEGVLNRYRYVYKMSDVLSCFSIWKSKGSKNTTIFNGKILTTGNRFSRKSSLYLIMVEFEKSFILFCNKKTCFEYNCKSNVTIRYTFIKKHQLNVNAFINQ